MSVSKARSRANLQSLNEIFATKKNIASQASFEHRVDSLTKDFYNRRESLQLKIKAACQEMKDIRSSTGYSLDEVSYQGRIQDFWKGGSYVFYN